MARGIPLRAHGPALVSNAAATKYTVPAGRKAIMRKMTVNNPTGAAVNFTWSIGADAAATRIRDAFPIPAQGANVTENVKEWYGPYTLEAGEIIQAFAATNNVLVLEIDVEEFVLGA